MFDIFHRSFVTLGVASTSSCHESFLDAKSQRFYIEFQSKTKAEVSRVISLHKAPPTSSPTTYNWGRPIDPWERDLVSSERNQRGWVWQEQNMAPRLPVFGESMFHLRGRGVDSEDGSTGGSQHIISDPAKGRFDGEMAWYEWMNEYSRRSFLSQRIAYLQYLG